MARISLYLILGCSVLLILLADCIWNYPPVIESLTASDTLIAQGEEVTLTCVASDPEDGEIKYHWLADAGTFNEPKDSSVVVWVAPNESGDYSIACKVYDKVEGNVATDSVSIKVTGN